MNDAAIMRPVTLPRLNRVSASLTLAALGVVFGDLGTSPLYALQEAFHGKNGVVANPENIVGVVSLFLWALFLMVSLKYVTVLMRADNHGEGGLLALLSLLIGDRNNQTAGRRARRWIILAMIGTAMFYGDGLITPAISVLSAVEGLEVITPTLTPYVVPITVTILIALFAIQPLGAGKIGFLFGPILSVWFIVLFAMGLVSIMQTPQILNALNPLNGIVFFQHNGFHGFLALGAVVLCLGGGEALYADMGHFGAFPIRLAWYGLALPSLAMNYMGQGALLLREPANIARPFYSIAPVWGVLPLVILATLATVVAAQALISAVFTLTRQASQLGLGPRVLTRHTSHSASGQIYLPTMNWLLMCGTIAIVLIFRRSDHLAAAFGLAISMTMSITSVIFVAFARTRWHWSTLRVLWVAGVFMAVDKAFVIANTLKFTEGGWLPFAIGAIIFLLSYAWFYGIRVLRQSRTDTGLPIAMLIEGLSDEQPHRVSGTAVFMMPPGGSAPVSLLHHLKHNQAIHQAVILLTIVTEEAPRVTEDSRLAINELKIGFTQIVAHYGYMEAADVPALLRLAQTKMGREIYDPMTTSYYLGKETLSVPFTGNIVKQLLLTLFVWLHKNELDSTNHFGIPPNRVVELGARLDLIASTCETNSKNLGAI